MTTARGFVTLLLWLACRPAAVLASEDPSWSVRVDVRGLERAGVFASFRDAAAHPAQAARLERLEAVTGLRPERDVDEVSMSGTDARVETAACVLRGRFDAAKLAAFAARLPEHRLLRLRGREVHAWRDPSWKVTWFACLAEPAALVVTLDEARMRSALKELRGPAPAALPSGSLLAGRAGGMTEWEGLGTGAEEVRNLDHAEAAVACSGEALSLTATAQAASSRRAMQLVVLGRALVFFLNLKGRIDAPLVKAIAALRIERRDADLDLALSLPIADARELALEHLDRQLRRYRKPLGLAD